MSVVIVLTPNGRRQNVKITPNTTLLQVLEEVCTKHEFKPEEYDLRHHNKILDLSNTFQFSGLPNNAQLEMYEAKSQRSETPVMLGLHLESGDRLTGEFTPSVNLWEVITTLNCGEHNLFENPTVIYMRKEICGIENLQKTTLRNLGLTGGRAILRYVNKTPDELRTQANVSAELSRSAVYETKRDSSKSPERRLKESPKPSPNPVRALLGKDYPTNIDKGRGINSRHDASDSVNEFSDKKVESKQSEKKVIPSKKSEVTHRKKDNTSNVYDKRESNIKTEDTVNDKKTHIRECESTTESKVEDKKAILLGERNAVAYNLNTIKPVVYDEMPDDFYELTVSDAKLLLRDAKQLCAELEDAPLMTTAQRELEKNKKMLSLLNQYKKTVLRIKFPDRTVLQGTFSSVERISAVEKFVTNYLENPNISFYLYTSPPKEVLKSDLNLLESNCVPCAVLYFGLSSSEPKCNRFLRSDVVEKFSSPSAAALTAYQSRGITANKKIESNDIQEDIIIPTNDSIPVAGPSSSPPSSQSTPRRGQESSPPFKVPKWFKMNK